MVAIWKKSQFELLLNSNLKLSGGIVTGRKGGAKGSKNASKKIILLGNIDLVVEGACSSRRWGSAPEEMEKFMFFLGRNLKELQPKKALIFPTCCKQYSPRDQEKIIEVAEGVEVIFPNVKDFASFFSPGYDMFKDGVQFFVEQKLIGLSR